MASRRGVPCGSAHGVVSTRFHEASGGGSASPGGRDWLDAGSPAMRTLMRVRFPASPPRGTVRRLFMARRPHVALLIETAGAYGRRLLQGITRYLHMHRSWSIFLERREIDSV